MEIEDETKDIKVNKKQKVIFVKDFLYLGGGRAKIVIYDTSTSKYIEVWKGIVDDIDWEAEIPCGDYIMQGWTVVNDEDILQIFIDFSCQDTLN